MGLFHKPRAADRSLPSDGREPAPWSRIRRLDVGGTAEGLRLRRCQAQGRVDPPGSRGWMRVPNVDAHAVFPFWLPEHQ